jgi:hypothetical protein
MLVKILHNTMDALGSKDEKDELASIYVCAISTSTLLRTAAIPADMLPYQFLPLTVSDQTRQESLRILRQISANPWAKKTHMRLKEDTKNFDCLGMERSRLIKGDAISAMVDH